MSKETYTVRLQSTPGQSIPETVRLRGLLKVAMRRFGLRCLEVSVGEEGRPETQGHEHRVHGTSPQPIETK